MRLAFAFNWSVIKAQGPGRFLILPDRGPCFKDSNGKDTEQQLLVTSTWETAGHVGFCMRDGLPNFCCFL